MTEQNIISFEDLPMDIIKKIISSLPIKNRNIILSLNKNIRSFYLASATKIIHNGIPDNAITFLTCLNKNTKDSQITELCIKLKSPKPMPNFDENIVEVLSCINGEEKWVPYVTKINDRCKRYYMYNCILDYKIFGSKVTIRNIPDNIKYFYHMNNYYYRRFTIDHDNEKIASILDNEEYTIYDKNLHIIELKHLFDNINNIRLPLNIKKLTFLNDNYEPISFSGFYNCKSFFNNLNRFMKNNNVILTNIFNLNKEEASLINFPTNRVENMYVRFNNWTKYNNKLFMKSIDKNVSKIWQVDGYGNYSFKLGFAKFNISIIKVTKDGIIPIRVNIIMNYISSYEIINNDNNLLDVHNIFNDDIIKYGNILQYIKEFEFFDYLSLVYLGFLKVTFPNIIYLKFYASLYNNINIDKNILQIIFPKIANKSDDTIINSILDPYNVEIVHNKKIDYYKDYEDEEIVHISTLDGKMQLYMKDKSLCYYTVDIRK